MMMAVHKRGGGPAPFLTKTHQMVDEKYTDEVISWGEKGSSFVVWKPVEFARDLLPLYFKHNNFSSFVRQLNTYGFRKVVPDRWEFANDNFRRGEHSLLTEIRRRKVTQPPHAAKSGPAFPPPLPPMSVTNSGNDRSSSSTSSLPPDPALVNENEQLKKDNKILTTELAQAKRHCEELLGFLSQFLDVRQLNFRLLMQEDIREKEESREVGVQEVKEENCVKLFGVLLKDGSRKRGRCEEGDVCGGVGKRSVKMTGFVEPWVAPAASVQCSGGKVCN